MTVYKKLIKVQKELKAPKNQRNSFGNYNYRSCEDILEALKPLLLKHKLSLTISDSIVYLGDRFFVKATASANATTLDKITKTNVYRIVNSKDET